MAIAAETLIKFYRNFTSADATATDFTIASGSPTEGVSLTSVWVSNQDTISHTVKFTLQCYNGASYDNALVRSYTIAAGASALIPEFVVPLTYRNDGNNDLLKAQIAESVNSPKLVHVYCGGAAFTAS